MTGRTTAEIRKWSTDDRQSNSMEAIMDYYGVTSLREVSEEQGLMFLAKLESGEIRIPKEMCDFVENE